MTIPQFPPLIRSSRFDGLRAVFGVGFFGYHSYISASLPDRLYMGLDDARRPPTIIADEPALDTQPVVTPLEMLLANDPPGGAGWPTASRQAIGRLEALWLLAEDRQRLLDAQAIDPLPHQAALVEHVLATAGLERVLIADEVGLGKTIEAGLIVHRLQQANPTVRVLYLTEARLVPNVVEEFERIGLNPRPRLWTADRVEARLKPGDSDAMVVASIHKAVANADLVAASGPWDVLIVDEAHHLTDYSPDGGDPQERMRLVRRLVTERLTPSGRLLLLSGTPHQGHLDRFKNLLRLLSPRDDERDAAGKVIYRIKDDIRGWDGEPLFPLREVHPHRSVSVSPEYHTWMADVHRLLAPGPGASRASAWRRAQALQWCASSPEAGLAYLARLAIRSGRRVGTDSVLRRALEVLRPYRGGPSTEPIDTLERRMLGTSPEFGEDAEEVFGGGESLLQKVLQQGADLVAGDAFGQKLASLAELLAEAPDEKFVVFAQPIETVYTLKRRLEAELGSGAVAFIVGGQTLEQRRAEIDRFVGDSRVRVMVSSRSGGEGINLQVSRRLVHFDVPWNPMEMEQRVGRVHRYGGVRTIIVDTLVLEGSRETRVLSRARARLGAIVKDLDRSRFELLFSRTMALIPLEELAILMAGEQFAPLDQDEEDRLDTLVQRGHQLLDQSEEEFRRRAAILGEVDRGEVEYGDLESWLERVASAQPAEGYHRRVLADVEDGRRPVAQPARLFSLNGSLVFVTPMAGVAVEDVNGSPVRAVRLGLNAPDIAERIRAAVAEATPGGAAAVLVSPKDWQDWCAANQLGAVWESGGILLVYLVRRLEPSASAPERSCRLHGWLVSPDVRNEQELSSRALAQLVRLVRDPRPKVKPPIGFDSACLREAEARHLAGLRAIEPGEPVPAVFPIVAVAIDRG